jgi:glutaredoxin-like YruB-family protein
MAEQIKVYTTPTCPWCKKTRQFLDDNNTAYENIDVTTDNAGREEMINKTGQLSVPVIVIDGETIIGYDENWLKQKLNL